MNVTPSQIESGRSVVLSKIRDALVARRQTLADAIVVRELYFRVSLLGQCNLRCPFCHNEGAPSAGMIEPRLARMAIGRAREIGFTRVQFTGGEPLLHPDVHRFVAEARGIFADVGVTTNGTRLPRRLNALVDAGLTRIHVSLQVETLIQAGERGRWAVPLWLASVLGRAGRGEFALRVNLPVPHDQLDEAARFLRELSMHRSDVKVFAILPAPNTKRAYPIDALVDLVEKENARRTVAALPGRILLRGYRPPSGLRCGSCSARPRCQESSRSLRLGADHVLRPCLATRDWDEVLVPERLDEQMTDAALLALDYVR